MLYGTTSWGTPEYGPTVFTINRDGTGYKILKAFGTAPGALQPYAPLLLGSDGALYGTASSGGTVTIFRLSTSGSNYTVLTLISQNTGGWPWPLLQGADGALYGTATLGGNGNGAVTGAAY